MSSQHTLSACRDPQRRRRLNSNVVTLYHGTDAAHASQIDATGLLRGPFGWAGAGIYFASTAAAACNLSRKHGVVLEVQVKLGNVQTVQPPVRNLTFTNLAHQGYDSVVFSELGHDLSPETVYAIYNKDQAKVVRRVAWVGALPPRRLPR